MKYIKMLGLAVIAAAALIALAGTASATTLTNGEGKHPTTISLTSSHGIFKNALITITCTHSAINAHASTGGEGLTVNGSVTAWDFTNCGSTWDYTIVGGKFGTLETHSTGGGNGTLTSTGTELTAEQTGSGLHCVFTTSNTTIGTITGSKNTGGAAVLHVNAAIPRTGGRSGAFCGGTTHWTGSYTFTSPTTLNID